ncbi:MAG: hypothetical protein DME26_07790 [Verrucomicrobia bacterium]|nr:MAG: hypothetical protein DME26_07790 [Verrucomicrobiota bacterium]
MTVLRRNPIMKSLVPFVPAIPPSRVIPYKPAALVFFWALAFLPAIVHLIRIDWPVRNLLIGVGPIAAGFWFAATICQTRLSLALVGTLLSVLVWLVNWLMLAGNSCCSMG